MTLQTRGSAALDKAQRRLANLKSIDESLDLGHGLTIAAYTHMIETTRTALESHNTLVSNIDASRQNVTELEKVLSEMSGRMLTGVATKYGKSSTQYRKAGGSTRKSSTRSTQPLLSSSPETAQAALPKAAMNGSTTSKAEQPV